MNKENILFAIIGLLGGLIIGFLATNYINRNSQTLIAATAAAPQTTQNAPFAPQGQPQINNQVVAEQPQTGGRAGGAALPQIQEVLDRANNEPTNFEAQIAAGDMYYRIKGFDKAGQFYEKAAQLKPDNYDAHIKAGNAYFDADQFEHAEEHYTKALDKNPNDVNVRTDLGLTFFLRTPKNVDRAIGEYQKSLQVNPNHELTLQNLAAAQREKGDTAAMQETLARLETVNPKNDVIVKLRNGQ